MTMVAQCTGRALSGCRPFDGAPMRSALGGYATSYEVRSNSVFARRVQALAELAGAQIRCPSQSRMPSAVANKRRAEGSSWAQSTRASTYGIPVVQMGTGAR